MNMNKTPKKFSRGFENIFKYLSFLYSFGLGRKQLRYTPISLMIEPTNICNLKCDMCPQSGLMTREKGMMDFELYKKIIDEAKDFIQFAQLFHTGESLIHPKIFEMIDYASKANVYTMLHTNGTMLSNNNRKKLFSSGLDYLSFSFEAIRKKDNLKNSLANILSFLEESNKATKPFTVVEVINMKDLHEDIDEIKNIFSGTNLNMFRIRQHTNWSEKELQGNLMKTRENIPKLLCEFPYQSMAIHWNGDVVPCCLDFDAKYKLGNVTRSSLVDIWNGNKMQRLREVVKTRDYNSVNLCGDCSFLWTGKSYYTFQGKMFSLYARLLALIK